MLQSSPTAQSSEADPLAGRPEAVRWSVRVAMLALVAAALVYVVSTIPGVRSNSGFVPVLDGWFQGATYALTAVVAGLRPALSRVDRLLWSLVAVALALRAVGFIYYFFVVRTQVPQPYPSLSDAFWTASSLVMIAALVVLARASSRHRGALLALDALTMTITAAGVTAMFLHDTVVDRAGPGTSSAAVTVNLAYPLMDVALLGLAFGVVTMARARLAASVWLLLLGVVGFTVIDAVFLVQITAGTFEPATMLSGLNMVSTVVIAFAGWVLPRHRHAHAQRAEADEPTRGGLWIGPRGILVPVVCAVVCVVTILYATDQDQRQLALTLPALGVLLVIARGVTTVLAERDVADRELRLKNDELLRFQSLVEASSDFIAIAGVDGTVAYVNPAGRKLVGLAPDADVTRTTIADYLTEEGLQASLAVEQPAVVAQGHWEGESTLRDMGGGPPVPVAINSFLMLHPVTGEPMSLATVQRDITDRKSAEQGLRDLADQRQELLDRLIQAQEDERARIAADVHDDSVQALAALELRLGMLRRQVQDSDPRLLPGLEASQLTLETATSRLRHLLFDLDSPARRDPLPVALEQAATYVFEDAVPWQLTGDRDVDLPEALRVTAYRIAKEAMVNARKHADPSLVRIELAAVDGGVEVAVVDDGRGAGPEQLREVPGHLGLGGMRDRATVAGGRLTITSAPGEGTAVRLWLPDPGSDPATTAG
ncbi:PAS domain S-box protein [Nocardioides guangzhouensis]|uniref:histidine kinase n=1 Tax=Nocardioides guangzhouensis TaxID=2497878 RepID=A0A4Q4ZK42_9ACTN|nr:ATP-binding protein [Nocardioides guangzhouensis]RYP88378.1 PAS domain S-box protein [Nocardioides guangzhouensis]